MRILITNDDGVFSEGLWELAEALGEIGEVCVAAPDRDMSGIGTAMTLTTVLRAQEFPSPIGGVEAYAVQGTPSDCVVLATKSLFAEPFDLVVSGINRGANIGMDVLISGTVGGALKAYFNGFPAIAVSSKYTDGSAVQYGLAASVARELARGVRDRSVAQPMLLNVNTPDGDPRDIKVLDVTGLGPIAYAEQVESGKDGRRTHYWLRHFNPKDIELPPGTDVWAVRNGRISVTPVEVPGVDAPPPDLVDALVGDVRAALGLEQS